MKARVGAVAMVRAERRVNDIVGVVAVAVAVQSESSYDGSRQRTVKSCPLGG